MNRTLGLPLLFLLACCVPGAPSQTEAGRQEVLTLQEAIRTALARAPEVSLAEGRAARAEQALRETRSLNLPQVVTGTGLAYNNGFPLSIEGSAPSIFQVAASQSILNRTNKNLILEAEASSRASRTGLDAARNDLAAKTALLYSELHEARRAQALWSERLEIAREEQELTRTLLESGKVRPLDLTLAKVATANVEQQLLVAREQVRMAEAGLKEALGITEAGAIHTEEPRIESALLGLSSADLYQQALEMHPEIRRAGAQLQAKEFHVEAAKGERYPRLEIVGQYALFSRANNYQDYFNRFTRNNYLVGLSVQFPVFNGFRTAARISQSRREAEEARLQLQTLKSNLRLGIERDASNLRVARGALGLAVQEARAAEENLQVSETLFEAGRIDPKDLAGARSEMVANKVAVVSARKAVFESEVTLLQAAGALASLF